MIPPDLGTYVVARPRKNGTCRVFFEVPKRLRPGGWPATIPIPRIGRMGDLRDTAECQRIRDDARDLLSALNEKRSGREAPPPQSWDTLFRLWHSSSRFSNTSRVTQEGYLSRSRSLLKILTNFPAFQPATLLESEAEAVLNTVESPDTRRIYLSIFNSIMKKAIKEKWRLDNPFSEIRCQPPNRVITLWTREDIEALAQACVDAGQPGVGGVIWTGFELGQRLTDIRKFRHGVEYVDGVFRFWQSKTNQYVTIPAPPELQSLITNGEPGDHLFVNEYSGQPFSMQSLSVAFKKIRNKTEAAQGKRLLMQKLRHSSVYQFALAECEIYEIASVTGHSFATVHKILEHYLPRDSALASRAMKKRKDLNAGMQARDKGPRRVPPRPGLRPGEPMPPSVAPVARRRKNLRPANAPKGSLALPPAVPAAKA